MMTRTVSATPPSLRFSSLDTLIGLLVSLSVAPGTDPSHGAAAGLRPARSPQECRRRKVAGLSGKMTLKIKDLGAPSASDETIALQRNNPDFHSEKPLNRRVLGTPAGKRPRSA